MSLLIVIAYGVFEFVWQPFEDSDLLMLNPVIAGLAALQLAYIALGYRVVKRSSPQMAGWIGFGLFAAVAAALVHSTGGFASYYLGLWIALVLAGGIFGTLMLGTLTAVSIVYFLLGRLDVLSDVGAGNYAVFAGVLASSVVSWLLWRDIELTTRPGAGQEKLSDKERDRQLQAQLTSQILVESIADGVLVVDYRGVIQVFNPAAERITGWTDKEAVGLDFRSVMRLSDADDNAYDKANDPFIQVFSTRKAVKDDQAMLSTRSDKKLSISLLVSPIVDKKGVVSAVVGVFRDISKERVEEKQRAEFISTASHEMRTPVAAIEGYLALAMNENVSRIDSKAREYLDKAHSSTQHLGKLFQDLLTAAKSEDGRLQSNPVVVDIGQFVGQITEDVRFSAEKKGLVVELDSGGKGAAMAGGQVIQPLYYAQIDPDRMREVITNLFDNAVKYTDEGKITIRLSGDDKNVIVSVTDTGAGIPKEDIPHLFQKFYRVDNSATRQIGGTGLGLFIARQIVELYQGRIWVESELGQGSTFFIALPRIETSKAQEQMKIEQAQRSPLSQTPTGPATRETTPTPVNVK